MRTLQTEFYHHLFWKLNINEYKSPQFCLLWAHHENWDFINLSYFTVVTLNIYMIQPMFLCFRVLISHICNGSNTCSRYLPTRLLLIFNPLRLFNFRCARVMCCWLKVKSSIGHTNTYGIYCVSIKYKEPPWPWSYGSWIYDLRQVGGFTLSGFLHQ